MKAGLEDIVVSTTEICFIDGHKGRLVYRGYDVDDLVAHAAPAELPRRPFRDERHHLGGLRPGQQEQGAERIGDPLRR